MTVEMEQQLAKKKGWHRLGVQNVDIKIPLTDPEKLELGEKQSDALMQMQQLESEKKEYDDDMKGQIKQLQNEAYEAARELKYGHKTINRDLPCFLDNDAQERVYVDLETGEELRREPMRVEDRQMRLDS